MVKQSADMSTINSKSDFDAALKEPSLMILDCFATWCGPCKVIAPQVVKYVLPPFPYYLTYFPSSSLQTLTHPSPPPSTPSQKERKKETNNTPLHRMSDTYPDARFYKLDVDEVPEVAQELAIRAMPTFVLFKDGKKCAEVVGANPKALEAAIKSNM
jgi:thioredoxin 1